MKRREFITLVGGTVIAWPLTARAQQLNRKRHIGVLIPRAANDPESVARTAALAHELQQLGWVAGRNVRIDTIWAGGSVEATYGDIRKHAVELVASAPDVILAHGSTTVAPLLTATTTVPIVFVSVADPVGGG